MRESEEIGISELRLEPRPGHTYTNDPRTLDKETPRHVGSDFTRTHRIEDSGFRPLLIILSENWAVDAYR
jgi:hypothetical protein